ncbi:MAG: hypothetical protein IIC99_04735 [Chloroflexi bacterium]|nr:hypothetical protein [Chloroflexota bacterium]
MAAGISNSSLKLILAVLAAGILAGCAAGAPTEVFVGAVPEGFMTSRANYDTSTTFDELVRPHFFARSEDGDLVAVQGEPDRLVIRDGMVKIRLRQGKQKLYLDPLALTAGELGEHPVHRIYRLAAMGIPLDQSLGKELKRPATLDRLFHTLEFEYLRDKPSRGTIAEVFPDGTFLVIPFDPPEAWRSPQEGVASPTHLHVNPRALTVAGSALAQDYEKQILSLSFDQQRYPPPEVARKQCGVYQEALSSPVYKDTLDSIGFRFTPAHVLTGGSDDEDVAGERLTKLIREGAGEKVRYFGMEGSWISGVLTQLDVSWLGDCDTAGGVRRYRVDGESKDRFYLRVRRSLEPDKRDRHKIVALDDDGSIRVIYDAPGIVLMALPLPTDDSRWLMSTEGWPKAGAGIPADPRWQSVYLVNVNDPEDYQMVDYPIHQFPRAPEAGLYGASPRLSDDKRFLFNTLYGFKDEGGGVWVTDISKEDFFTDASAFTRIVDWDHALSWMLLEPEPEDPTAPVNLFLTGKEVSDDFAMTANVLSIGGGGLDSSIQSQQRLLQMVGWNPVPFAQHTLGDGKFLVAVETHFDYESSLLPRAKGVYIVPVDLGR